MVDCPTTAANAAERTAVKRNIKREPTEKVTYRLRKGLALGVGKLADELEWSEARAAGFVLEAGLAALYGRDGEVDRLREVGNARRKVAAAEREARALVAKVRKQTADVLRPKKPADAGHQF